MKSLKKKKGREIIVKKTIIRKKNKLNNMGGSKPPASGNIYIDLSSIGMLNMYKPNSPENRMKALKNSEFKRLPPVLREHMGKIINPKSSAHLRGVSTIFNENFRSNPGRVIPHKEERRLWRLKLDGACDEFFSLITHYSSESSCEIRENKIKGLRILLNYPNVLYGKMTYLMCAPKRVPWHLHECRVLVKEDLEKITHQEKVELININKILRTELTSLCKKPRQEPPGTNWKPTNIIQEADLDDLFKSVQPHEEASWTPGIYAWIHFELDGKWGIRNSWQTDREEILSCNNYIKELEALKTILKQKIHKKFLDEFNKKANEYHWGRWMD